MSGFAEKKIAVNSEENALDDDEKIGAREVISEVSCYDSRDGSVFISSISIGGGNYRVKRHNNEIVFQRRVKGEEKASLKEKVRRNLFIIQRKCGVRIFRSWCLCGKCNLDCNVREPIDDNVGSSNRNSLS